MMRTKEDFDTTKMQNKDRRNDISVSLRTCTKRIICIKQWNVDYFFKIIDEELDNFLDQDRCFLLADNYLIAMVFTYFLRASLKPEEYTPFNFFVALYIAHDMEEDEDQGRMDLQEWANLVNKQTCTSFIQHRDRLFQRMEFRGAVSRLCCNIVMRSTRPFHKIWLRERHVNHGGAASRCNRKRNTCPHCYEENAMKLSRSSHEYNSPQTVRVVKSRRSIALSNRAKSLDDNLNEIFPESGI